MTTTTDRLVEHRPATSFARPPRYTWVPVFMVVGLPLLFAVAAAVGFFLT
jgi:hypothetical protein